MRTKDFILVVCMCFIGCCACFAANKPSKIYKRNADYLQQMINNLDYDKNNDTYFIFKTSGIECEGGIIDKYIIWNSQDTLKCELKWCDKDGYVLDRKDHYYYKTLGVSPEELYFMELAAIWDTTTIKNLNEDGMIFTGSIDHELVRISIKNGEKDRISFTFDRIPLGYDEATKRINAIRKKQGRNEIEYK